ncbi:Methionyl-tRNA formyltransferase [Methylophaga frappieri]|jgi:methionyl-tRNA formyltransferase|uniref:Methionyl-tRNA formyltransferase n=1 Tax=Methylophaga frappieri (strain ATCC BAA-2434 / DSM 25690 / JAM7) TaxID=754477 RepID=I1YJI8_METFJ|nr:methionyl-tRNA formyltransferase [Methylophaga frappieri]AFJ03081.1 Methionyl-tRNA formyltransferase [Methylophaga frappieri]
MRILFAGTPEFAATTLSALITSEHEIVAVYTQPDRPAGRGRKLTASPVKTLAQQHNLTVEQPVTLRNTEAQQKLADYQAEVMIVVAYGLILPQTVLDTPTAGCLNIHASLLPRWRGAAPIQRAILAGDTQTGVCIMQMAAGLDTGPVLSQVTLAIDNEETAQTLHDRLAEAGATLLMQTLATLDDCQQAATEQADEFSCYAEKLHKSEAIIDWHQSAEQIDRQIRAFNPWPVAQTLWRESLLRIWRATPLAETSSALPGTLIRIERDALIVATGEGCLQITEIQRAGKRRMRISDLLNAQTLNEGDQFG